MKSAILITIGVALIGLALMLNKKASDREGGQQRINDAVSHLGYSMSGSYEYKKAERRDRTGLYVMGGLGGIAIITGIATLGSHSPKRQ